MLRKRHTYRTRKAVRILASAAMACMLAMTAVMPASAATARATTMKLEKTEGTATLKTQNGTARKITTGMRLFSGNTLATAASSYAYVSLDSSKAVKLDEKTSTTLRQSGKKLELLVKSGKLFFNVSSPLTEKEDMNIRTSTMVTGIRGTCGVVEYVNVNKSRLYLIEGQVTLGSGKNATTVYGGQTATVVLQEKGEAGESGGPGENGNTEKNMEQKVYVEKLTEASVPIFAITEILSDPVLQQKIEKTTELKIKKFEEVLEESQKEPGEEEETKTDDTTTSGGNYVPSDPQPTETTLKGSSVTAEKINEAFKNSDTVTLAADDADDGNNEILPIEKLDVPENKTLVVDTVLCVGESDQTSGNINVNTGGALVINANGSLINYGELINNGTLTNNGILDNAGTITGKGIILGEDSKLINIGTMTATSSWSVSNAIIDNTGTIDMGANTISVTGDLNLSNVGTITGNGAAVISLTDSGTLTLGSGSSANGSISNTSTENGHYAITVGAGKSIELKDEIVQISTGTADIGNTIKGLGYAEGGVTGGANILKNDTQEYDLDWDKEKHVLKLIILQ